ncbi:MAG: purine-nucleoside phosphorylase [Bdellovibrionales bacterium]|nr:purine-nucleoside phosphorylase [Bdellovibrionales bacterium]
MRHALVMLTSASVSAFLKHCSTAPFFHVVLGSGFGAALQDQQHGWEKTSELSFADVQGLTPSTVPDHAGKYAFYRHGTSGRVAVMQMGRLHGYEGHDASAVVGPVMVSRLSGCGSFLLTNAAGGLRREFRSGDVMLITDHVNLTGRNPLVGSNPVGPDGKGLGDRFPDLSHLYDAEWRRRLKGVFSENLRVWEGVYLGLLGPSFETPAEVQLFARWGLDAVGMSTVWEAIALRHAGARVAGLSLISNPGAGLDPSLTLDHVQILETCRASAARIVDGVFRFLQEMP